MKTRLVWSRSSKYYKHVAGRLCVRLRPLVRPGRKVSEEGVLAFNLRRLGTLIAIGVLIPGLYVAVEQYRISREYSAPRVRMAERLPASHPPVVVQSAPMHADESVAKLPVSSVAGSETRKAVVLRSAETLGTPDVFFDQLKALIAQARWDDAHHLIVELRAQRPAWLASRVRDLRWAELDIALGSEDALLVRTITRDALRDGLSSRDRLLDRAGVLKEAGKAGLAEIIVREILLKHPNDDAAKRLAKAFGAMDR